MRSGSAGGAVERRGNDPRGLGAAAGEYIGLTWAGVDWVYVRNVSHLYY